MAALTAAAMLSLLLPLSVASGVVDPGEGDAGTSPIGLVTQPLGDGLERILADGAGHRLDGGRIREVEVTADGTIWVAAGRSVLALGQPGSIEPRGRGWQAFPRQLRETADGGLWAVEDGGTVVVLAEGGWSVAPDDQSLPVDVVDHPDGRLRVLATASGLEGERWAVADATLRRARPAGPVRPAAPA